MPFWAKGQESGAYVASPYTAFSRQTAIWLLRLMEFDIPIDDSFFDCAGWACGGTGVMAKRLLKALPAPRGRTQEAATIRANLKRVATGDPHNFHCLLEELYEEGLSLQGDIIRAVRQQLIEAAKGGGYTLKRVMAPMARIFDLDAPSQELCALAFCLGNFKPVEHYLEDVLEIYNFQNLRLMTTLLNIPIARYKKIHAALKGMGILDADFGGNLRLSDNLDEALREDRCKDLQMQFCRPLKPASVHLDQFRIDEEDRDYVTRLLTAESSDPVHILLYGAPGSGKSSFASALAHDLGLAAWAVPCDETDSSQSRRVSLTACLKLASRHPGSFVLVDEAERLLDTDFERESGASQKAWLNGLMEQKGTRIIWITNKVSHLDQAVRRRFAYSVFFDDLGREERRQMWLMVVERLHVRKKLTDEWLDHFVDTYPVPVATIENAIRQAKNIKPGKRLCEYMDHYLKSQLALRHNGFWRPASTTDQAGYDPAAVCLKTPLPELLKKVGRIVEKIRDPKISAHGMGTMLFWGPPGTGKTALARYMAREYGLECRSFKASDLLGPYVGETEAKIAQMFATADKDTLLLVDEVDSFIGSRENASHQWEESMVNEFLTQLEAFEGLCVCTTNYRDMLDLAAFRRLSFKVEFTYAAPDQIELLYRNILAPLASGPVPDSVLEVLRSQKCLAPGDFHAVKMQFWLEDPGDVSHAMLKSALLKEQRLKLDQAAKTVGFM